MVAGVAGSRRPHQGSMRSKLMSETSLISLDHLDELAQVHNALGICGRNAGCGHQVDFVGAHFPQLIGGNSRFQCEEMLFRNSLGFGKKLPPTILASGFGFRHLEG